MILIGSTAIKTWFPDFKREPKDVDYAINKEVNFIASNDKEQKVELLVNPVLCNYMLENYPTEGIALPNVLYTLKLSHAVGWDINWEKHVYDIQFLKSKDCKIIWSLFYDLYNYWQETHKNKRSNLQMSADEFFDNAVTYPVKHDDLHKILNPVPTYTKILVGEVEVSEKLFNCLTHQDKCNLVIEEVMVMALERYNNLNYKQAYNKMLKKFILNHAPLWESVFILENYMELEIPKFNFLKFFENELRTN